MSTLFRWIFSSWLFTSCLPKQSDVQLQLEDEKLLETTRILVERAQLVLKSIKEDLGKVQDIIDDPNTGEVDREEAFATRAQLITEYQLTKEHIREHKSQLDDVLATKTDVMSAKLTMNLEQVKFRALKQGQINEEMLDAHREMELDNRSLRQKLQAAKKIITPTTQVDRDAQRLGVSSELLERGSSIEEKRRNIEDDVARRILGRSSTSPVAFSSSVAASSTPIVAEYQKPVAL